jgi:serpin B
MKHFTAVLIVLLTMVPSIARTQDEAVPQLTGLIRANETFGRRLLAELHTAGLDKNVVVSPLGVSISFAPIRYASSDIESLREIDKVFGWDPHGLDLSSKMLLARFDSDNTKISTRFLFRKDAPISADFLKVIKKDFGAEFQAVDATATQQRIPSQGQDPLFMPPQVQGKLTSNFWLVNKVDLDAMWGNTFVMGKTKLDAFTLGSGVTKQTSMLVSELSIYGHVKTSEFEAIRLNCGSVYVLLVLPGQDNDIRTLEKSLAGGQALAARNLPQEIGDVELPEFHLQFEVDLRPTLEAMGMHRVFTDMDSMQKLSAQGAVLQGFWQKVDLTLDREGIHAHAFTVGGGITGGILAGASSPFHMVLNRPFLFLIHDNYTNSLLFVGVVVDPTKKELGNQVPD